MQKNLAEYNKKYALWRHHAWAAGLLLSALLAIRIFLEISEVKDIPNEIILIIGCLLLIYLLISLFFTYKYRSGLLAKQQQVIEIKSSSDEIEKERLKVEKKKAKAEAKKAKKKNKK
jgi:hypothetical protein